MGACFFEINKIEQIEQLDNNRLIRPKVIYEGAHNLEYPAIQNR